MESQRVSKNSFDPNIILYFKIIFVNIYLDILCIDFVAILS